MEETPTFEQFEKGLTGVGRDKIIQFYYQRVLGCIIFQKQMCEWKKIAIEAEANYQNAQATIRDLQAQLQSVGNGILLKGWSCRACGVFNGEEKERRSECRSCGLARQ